MLFFIILINFLHDAYVVKSHNQNLVRAKPKTCRSDNSWKSPQLICIFLRHVRAHLLVDPIRSYQGESRGSCCATPCPIRLQPPDLHCSVHRKDNIIIVTHTNGQWGGGRAGLITNHLYPVFPSNQHRQSFDADIRGPQIAVHPQVVGNNLPSSPHQLLSSSFK